MALERGEGGRPETGGEGASHPRPQCHSNPAAAQRTGRKRGKAGATAVRGGPGHFRQLGAGFSPAPRGGILAKCEPPGGRPRSGTSYLACTRIVASLHTPTGRLRSARWPAASKNRSSRRRRRIDRDGTRLSPWSVRSSGDVSPSDGRPGSRVVAAVGRGSRGTARARRPRAARGRCVPGR
jgi:hypothetical protein